MSVLMKKGNGERQVPEEKVAEFLALGYSVIDSEGKVLVEAEPTNLAEYKAALTKARKERDEYKAALDEALARAETAEKALEATKGQETASAALGSVQESTEAVEVEKSSSRKGAAGNGQQTAKMDEAK